MVFYKRGLANNIDKNTLNDVCNITDLKFALSSPTMMYHISESRINIEQVFNMHHQNDHSNNLAFMSNTEIMYFAFGPLDNSKNVVTYDYLYEACNKFLCKLDSIFDVQYFIYKHRVGATPLSNSSKIYLEQVNDGIDDSDVEQLKKYKGGRVFSEDEMEFEVDSATGDIDHNIQGHEL